MAVIKICRVFKPVVPKLFDFRGPDIDIFGPPRAKAGD